MLDTEFKLRPTPFELYNKTGQETSKLNANVSIL